MDPPMRPCPSCGAPMGYVPQYGQWYCARCQRYDSSHASHQQPPIQYGYQQPPPYNPWQSQGYYQQPAPPMGHGPWPPGYAPPTEESTKASLAQIAGQRPESEKAVSPSMAYGFLWAQAIFLACLYFSMTLVLIEGLDMATWNSLAILGVVFALWLVLGIVQAVLVYRLTDARDGHFKRDRALRETLMQHLAVRNSAGGGIAGMELATLGYLNASARLEDNGDRGALLWGVLAFVPVVNMITTPIILHGLTRDLAAHDRRQAFFCYYAGIAMARTGKGIQDPMWRQQAERSAGLYLLLAFITGSLFMFYWYYVTINDVNIHLASQRRFEDSLSAALAG
ncbi:MAG: hypothetical protein V1934_03705 [Methanobacteriota archaeon]